MVTSGLSLRLCPTLRVVTNSYGIDSFTKDAYSILFGSCRFGWEFQDVDLKYVWSVGIRLSTSKHFGDICLFYKGQLIRAILNADVNIRNKTAHYKYECIKYKFDAVVTNTKGKPSAPVL
mgnify:CR=1 FL=1